jgi:hypothetical protein
VATTTAESSPTIEHDGLLWKPKPGATATAEEFVAARTLMMAIHRDARWNPWVSEDRAAELAAAMDTFGEWTRAEPGFRQKTSRQVDAWMARMDREFKTKQERRERRYERNQKQYDAAREQARLALLEDEAYEQRLTSELEGYRSGQTFPGMPAARRQADIADLEAKLIACQQRLAELRHAVGNPEKVVDDLGRMPQDRRELNLWRYSSRREQEVHRLRSSTADKAAALAASNDKAERAEIRRKLRDEQSELDRWLSVAPLTPDDMCSECDTPMADHVWRLTRFTGPCPAWPRWAARVREARQMFFKMVEASKPSAPPPPPKPQPLAVVPSGLPIAEVMARLAEIQQEFSDAVIRRGRANRWEAWPAES